MHCKNKSAIFIPNCHRNHTKIEFGMIPVVICYEYHIVAIHELTIAIASYIYS